MWTDTEKFKHLSGFQKAVLHLCYTIPAGIVTSYACIGSALLPGRPCAQAVGNALRHNPFAPEVPCHRVVKADGTIGGFNGVTEKSHCQISKKRELLCQEGVVFSDDFKLKDRKQLRTDVSLWSQKDIELARSYMSG